jgi:DNA-binding NarL/FixJ family response regulator
MARVRHDRQLAGLGHPVRGGGLLKDAPREQLVTAVQTVARGEALLAPAITQRLIERFVARPPASEVAPALGEVSARELEVLQLVARGLSNRS